ncbi:hypothetical protein [Microbulbifer discodermiae]|uniref:hypothetical protein n=1 Tax=Microbulbifer sp. 2201CG32-9 TaxID=3232309 RepID=UPI00345BD621
MSHDVDPVKEYLEYKKSIDTIWNELDDLLDEKKLTTEFLSNGIVKIRSLTLKTSLRIQRYFFNLSDDEILKYVEAKEDQYNMDSEENSKKLDVLADLFVFIEQPSEALVKAHERHIKRLDSL